MSEVIATIQGIWSIVGNYGTNTGVVSDWWNEQYLKLMGGFGTSGAELLPQLIAMFSTFMPTAAASV